MRPTETAELVAYAQTMFPSQRFAEDTSDVWHDSLRQLGLGECRTAVANLAKRQKWLAVADIYTEVKAVRTAAPTPHFGPAGEAWRRCPWTACRCTHDGLCVAGWIDAMDGVRPCPTCRPEVASHLSMALDAQKARTSLPYLPRPSRRPA